jgi:hypothetical protein
MEKGIQGFCDDMRVQLRDVIHRRPLWSSLQNDVDNFQHDYIKRRTITVKLDNSVFEPHVANYIFLCVWDQKYEARNFNPELEQILSKRKKTNVLACRRVKSHIVFLTF